MTELLVFMLLVAAGAAASVCLAVALGVRHLVRRNRVAPRVRTGAPLSWLWSPLPHARLHRRLRSAVHAARLVCPPVRRRRPRTTVHDLVDDLVDVAVATDLRIVAATRLPRAERPAALWHLADEVRRVEELAGRVRAYASIGTPAHVDADTLDERLSALEAARSEVDGLDWPSAQAS